MRKRLLTITLAVCTMITSLAVGSMPVGAASKSENVYWPKGPKVASKSAIVMEANSGAILYEKNVHDKHYPASITKIMTTLLALENCNLDETVTFSENAVYKTEGTLIGRDVGEKMTLEQTLYAVMLGSANECAYATAEHVAGNITEFVKLMNNRAKEIGCVDTHFNNPHGLPDKKHYTSAYDMAMISKEALKNETFKKITGTKTYVIPPTNKHDDETYLVNHHAMLNYYHTGKYIYEDCIGGKTGYTSVAGNTLVTYAERNGMTLICVVMKSHDEEHYQDTTKLLEYCFNNFQAYNVSQYDNTYNMESVKNAVNFQTAIPYLSLDENAYVILPKTASFEDVTSKVSMKEEKGNVGGWVNYQYGDRQIGTANILISKKNIEAYNFGNNKAKEGKIIELSWLRILMMIVLLAMVVGSIIGVIYLKNNMNLIRYNMQRRRQHRENDISFEGRVVRRRRFFRRRR
ncbi:MAG: D-alanyl-D-alanine carboxypeptidase [Lachnospiraceae bacterium]|nr:D-alanyl-D-alanine carboxypeptidase [Lachnospiraceae bacterium]